jgi:ubiquinone/menaquinone biosynthesis C-methylase UbiE
MNWIIGIGVGVLIGYLLDREIYFYEGVHLGPRVQAWLYDRWSKKYDEGKRESQLRDAEMLARPLLNLLIDVPEPFFLDFATGTGRLSYALLSQPEFKGHIIALDLSQGMLEQAVTKISGLDTNEKSTRSTRPADNASFTRQASAVPPLTSSQRSSGSTKVEFVRHVSLPLPFPDSAFDVVCCLEVLELFPNMDEPLAELIRVLRPGGVLLSTRGTEESGRKTKVKSKADYGALLEKYNVENFQITTWWKLFDRVIAVKNGKSAPVGTKQLSAVMRCGACKQTQWAKEAGAWRCQNCEKELFITKEGIVLN